MKEDLRTIVDRLRSFDTGMLVTRSADGDLNARPMAVAEVDERGRVTFIAGRRTHLYDELTHDPHVIVTLQHNDLYAMVTGAARLTDDRTRIHALWRPAWQAWFPEGEGDPDLVLIDVEPHVCELWDKGGTAGLRNLASMAKAVVKGQRAQDQQGYRADHVVVRP